MLHGPLSPHWLNTANIRGNTMFFLSIERGKKVEWPFICESEGKWECLCLESQRQRCLAEMLPPPESPAVKQKGRLRKHTIVVPQSLCRSHNFDLYSPPLSFFLCFPIAPNYPVLQNWWGGWGIPAENLGFYPWCPPCWHRDLCPVAQWVWFPESFAAWKDLPTLNKKNKKQQNKMGIATLDHIYWREFIATHTDNLGDCVWKLLWWNFCD